MRPAAGGARPALAAALALAAACAGSAGGSLESLYPRGGSRFDVAFSGSHLGTTRFSADGALDAEARAALEALPAEQRPTVVGYDAYQIYRPRGSGHGPQSCEYRDYVFFDERDRIVGTTRRFVGC